VPAQAVDVLPAAVGAAPEPARPAVTQPVGPTAAPAPPAVALTTTFDVDASRWRAIAAAALALWLLTIVAGIIA